MQTPFDGRRTSRRRLLRAGGAGLAAGLPVFGAGCSSLPPLGTEVRFGTVDIPDRTAPAYRDWLPAPSTLPDATDATDGYNVLVHAPPPAGVPDWSRSSLPRTLVVGTTDYVGFHVDEADVVVGTDTSAVLAGDVDRPAVRDALARTAYEPAGTNGDYDVYERPDRDQVVGVGPDAVVFGLGSAARDAMAVTLTASRSESPRYHEDDEDLATLIDGTGMRRWAWLWPSGIGVGTPEDLREDTVGWATAFDHRGGTAYFVETWVFPETDDPTAGTIKGSLKQAGPAGAADPTNASAVDVSVDGRVATVAMQFDPDFVQEEFGGAAGPVPYTSWRSTYDAAAERLTVRHEVGDSIPTDRLTIQAPGLTVPAPEAGDVGDRIEPGDELTVSTADLGAGTTVRLVYRDPNGSSTTTLFSEQLP